MYPDAFVLCGPHAGNVTVVEDPVIVFEVLSAGHGPTRPDTQTARLQDRIPSLKAIVYVAYDRVRIDIVRRQAEGRWDDEDAIEGKDAVLELPEAGVSLPLDESLLGERDDEQGRAEWAEGA